MTEERWYMKVNVYMRQMVRVTVGQKGTGIKTNVNIKIRTL